MLSQVNGAKHQTTERLYWGQFGFKVVVHPRRKKNSWNSRFITTKEAAANLDTHLPSTKEDVKVQRNGYDYAAYFRKATDAQHFIQNVDVAKYMITDVVCPESEDHLALLSQDHKIVTRDSLFHQTFEWRVIFKVLDYKSKNDLQDWVNGYFDRGEVPKRYSFTYGVNCVLYLRDEDDVIVTKLTQASRVRKVEKVVLLNNNNNTGTDETRTLPQTD